MVEPRCVALAEATLKNAQSTWLCNVGPVGHASLISPALAAALVAFAGGIVGLLWNGFLQRRAVRRAREHDETTARATVYAELWRVWRETRFAIEFVEGDGKLDAGMIWIPVFRSIYPSKDNLARLGPLTAREVLSITSAYYVYQESMAFLKAAAYAVLPLVTQVGPEQGKRRAPFFSLEEDVIEFVYTIDGVRHAGRRDELLKWLRTTSGQAAKALAHIEAAVEKRFPGSDLAAEIRSRAARRSPGGAASARNDGRAAAGWWPVSAWLARASREAIRVSAPETNGTAR